MDTRTGELWSPFDAETAEEKVKRGAIDELTEPERRYVLAQRAGKVAWITPEVADQVRTGAEAKLHAEFERLKEQIAENNSEPSP